MKNKIFFVALSVLLLASCSKQMNYKEYNIYDKDYIVQTFENVGGFISTIYSTMEYDFGNYSSGAMLASASDESVYSIQGNAIEDFYNGGWSPVNAKSSTWEAMYKGIANCNHFLVEMQGLKFEDLKLNKDYQQQMYRYEHYPYEVRFMRAYFYFCLVRQYGGVPIVKESTSAAEINSLKRSTADEVFNYIINECNAIQDKIIADYSNLGEYALPTAETGRADKLAVLALKAQAALYWASPLFNASKDKNRWHTAATYYKELVAACSARGKDLTTNYKDTWDTKSYTTASISKEIIFERRTSANSTAETNNYPVGIEGGKGGNCPTQNLVDAYCMLNGKAIDEAGSGYDPNNPYANRDPRLNLTVAVNGSVWPSYSGAAALQTYVGGANGQPNAGATTTGYYLKKLLHGEINLASNSKYKTDIHTYNLYRMGAIYLDYAEAVFNYLGGADATDSEFTVSACDLASKTRVRAGLPAFETGLSPAQFWEKYKAERMVELAFENHRFYDVRRWKEADKYLKSIVSMKIEKEGNVLTYTRETSSRQWDDKMYLFPIPQSERLKNSNLEQNPGW